ncbi:MULTISPECIES: transketolase family protein [Pseudonocardia]|uniref:1-deoxy-D-xylulose-5-phosphate synthase n=2 Tax=Pseudonocardia TaxID=1847 RepID=A0A1Y2MK15_PSEAH|nr:MULTISPECIES: transketolase C-terminal domain-containing protein [Pseudonocardia]OSY34798.1 1-deoxy-D-xylulose-5-phosphate synthase [Pseudonocardia autotrophica]TDN76935.1 transketolase subunit B [Pseudonocardia autotrophica]BBG00939.1 transketolase [Pseudonocardia autotrophica]GEC29059.1 transketolase [Pseudonocardia saturnea]
MTAQDQSEIFNGTAAVGFADSRSTDGTDTRAIPAFVFGEELGVLADDDPRIVVLTADLGRSNRATDFALRHPDRFVNVGIAEKNMVTVAAGMAASGLVPFAATFGSFAALLCAEQIRTDCAYPNLPVRVVGHHSGMSMGFYGTSHHSLEDLAMMRCIADLTVVCATDANHLRALLRLSLDHEGAMYLRLGRGRDPEVYPEVPDLQLGRAELVREGSDLTVVATGSTVHPALVAADQLAADGHSVRVLDMWTVSPLDHAALAAAARETGALLTVEEANVTGGLGSAVAESLSDAGLAVPLRRHGVPDEHVPVGPPAALYAHYRLDGDGIAAVARELLDTRTRRNA